MFYTKYSVIIIYYTVTPTADMRYAKYRSICKVRKASYEQYQ